MLFLSVPTPFTSSFLTRLSQLNREFAAAGSGVGEIYGSFQSGMFHSARPAKYLPAVSRSQLSHHVAEAKQLGIRFNYLLNAPSYANLEYTHQGRRQLHDLLSFLMDCGVASVTVAIPYLIEIIRTHFPSLEIVVSTIGYTNSIAGLQQYIEAGAGRIVLDVEVNRDFAFLERAAETTSVPLELVANPVCISQCHFKYNHYCVASTGAQSYLFGGAGQPYNQYYLNWCFRKKLADHSEFLKSPWLRPADLALWTDIGIRYFKVAGRGQNQGALIRLCRSYLAQQFSGNLLDLLGWPHWLSFRDNPDGTRLEELDIQLDNDQLDGFLDFFPRHRPRCRLGCDRCGHCKAWADKVVKASDATLLKQYLDNMEKNSLRLVTQSPSQTESEREHAQWQLMASRQMVQE